jgi:hypothetical protein
MLYPFDSSYVQHDTVCCHNGAGAGGTGHWHTACQSATLGRSRWWGGAERRNLDWIAAAGSRDSAGRFPAVGTTQPTPPPPAMFRVWVWDWASPRSTDHSHEASLAPHASPNQRLRLQLEVPRPAPIGGRARRGFVWLIER